MPAHLRNVLIRPLLSTPHPRAGLSGSPVEPACMGTSCCLALVIAYDGDGSLVTLRPVHKGKGGIPGGTLGKNPPANAGDMGSILGLEDSMLQGSGVCMSNS